MSGHDVSVRAANGAEFTAFLTVPTERSRAARAPAVLVLQEIFGVNAFVRGACERLAAADFIAIAPDLFWRQEAGVQLSESDLERALRLMAGLDQEEAISDCSDAIAYVRALPNCSGHIGVVGYCLGGKLAYLMAARSKVAAAVSYYGVGIEGVLGEAKAITAPLLLHIGAEDALCPPSAQAAIQGALKGIPGVILDTHAGVGHAFARHGGATYVPQAAERADASTLAFLRQHLNSGH
jgi:carboxymethylenebutenolidase